MDDADLASALAHVMDSLAIAYKTVTKTTDSHGTKLRKAAESYEQSDTDTHEMYDDLMSAIDTGK